ncbi:ribosomal protein S18-alanine N-acetyltransferase [Okibacterium endophyticum]
MTWRVREAWPEDLNAIMGLERLVFANDAWSEETMRGELESEHTFYVVAYPVGDPVDIQGYAGLMMPNGAKEADIQTVAVAPEVRRMGLGRVLVQALINRARDARAREVFLEVRQDNPAAQALYAELGFESIGVRPGYYQPDDVDAVVMRHAISHVAQAGGAE